MKLNQFLIVLVVFIGYYLFPVDKSLSSPQKTDVPKEYFLAPTNPVDMVVGGMIASEPSEVAADYRFYGERAQENLFYGENYSTLPALDC